MWISDALLPRSQSVGEWIDVALKLIMSSNLLFSSVFPETEEEKSSIPKSADESEYFGMLFSKSLNFLTSDSCDLGQQTF